MTFKINNNFENSLILYELKKELNFFIDIYDLKKFPKVLMLSGNKGIGKFTIVRHFLSYVYDKNNYDAEKNCISNKSTFYKTASLNKERFIVLDDIELFNTNSLNALLKIIEEPTINNYFILINNKSRTLINTITSRALEVKISLKNKNRMNIIQNLIKDNKFDVFIDYKNSNLTPGNFIIFNKICEVNKINIDENFTLNLNKLLNLYKKNKDINLINMIIYLTNIFFYNLQNQNKSKIEKINQNKNFVIDNINKFIKYNINQTSLLNALSSKLSYE